LTDERPRIAVAGVGLIGGSVGMAARERLQAHVCGYDPDPEATAAGLRRGALDEVGSSLEDTVAGAQAVFVAAPVGVLPELTAAVLAVAPADCVVTDVGSTKRSILSGMRDPRFVGGHPLAGAETSGVEHARADLFEGATWYLTPGAETSGILYERLHRLLRALGAQPAAIDAETHDRMLAVVSHLPHVLANLLVAQAEETLAAGGERLTAVGSSFRDVTRVAGAPSTIWTDIYLSNRDALLRELDRVGERLGEIRSSLAAGDAEAVSRWNDEAAAARRRVLDRALAPGPLCELRASVPNRPGVVAELALALGRGGVNIADMALYPAADMSEGVVALWVSGAEAAARAQELVAGLGFPVART
jgi:prephenate dehydrogenase